MGTIKHDVRRQQHFAIRVPFGDSSSPLGDRQGANDSLPHADPCDGPSVGLPSTYERPRHLPKSVLFRRSLIAIPRRNIGSGRPAVSECEGERRPVRPEVVPQHPVGVGPCVGVAPPRWSGSSRPPCIRCTTTTDHSRAGHRGDSVQFRRCPSPLTPRCPQRFAVSPTRPALLRARSGSAFGSTHEGGATPPAVGNVDPRLVDVCPLRGRRSPLAAIRSRRLELRDCMEPAEREERQPMLRTVTALAPTRDRTGVLGRVKVSRASRAAATIGSRDLDAASARPRDGSCRSEQELTDVNTDRTRGRS